VKLYKYMLIVQMYMLQKLLEPFRWREHMHLNVELNLEKPVF
jgi:hypothetical protein